MSLGKREDVEAFRQVGLHPFGEPWRSFAVALADDLQEPKSLMTVRRIEDGADVTGDLGAHVDFGDVGSRVALKMDLAALPSDGGQDRAKSGLEASVVPASLHAVRSLKPESRWR